MRKKSNPKKKADKVKSSFKNSLKKINFLIKKNIMAKK